MRSRAPRVCLIGTVLDQPLGGVRRHNAELIARVAPRLVEAGGSLTVLSGRGGLALELPPRVAEIKTRVPSAPVRARAWSEPRALAAALDAARRAGLPFDVVHTAHLQVPGERALGGTPLVTLLHDLRQLDPLRVGRLRALAGHRLYARAAAGSTRLATVSEQVRATLERRYPAARGKTVVIPNAADHLARPSALPPPVRGLAPGYLLHVGHLEARKNLGLLLEALALDVELPDLVLAGTGHAAARLEAKARTLGVSERLHLLGRVDDASLPALYLHAACVVVPSHLEGFGLAAEEARQLGVRLAVADRGALPEVAGETAPRFDPHDARGAADAIRRALAGPEPSPSGRSWAASAERLLKLWRDAADEHDDGAHRSLP
ncbi:MAG: glycosyltransferase family 1 protein [Planctomycetota bacterium]